MAREVKILVSPSSSR